MSNKDYDANIGTVYIHEDEQVHCQSCHSYSTKRLGNLVLDGIHHRDVYKCQSCSTVFSANSSGMQELIDNAKTNTGADGAYFKPLKAGTGLVSNSTSISLDDSYQVTEVKDAINNLDNTMQSEISMMRSEISNLLHSIKEIVEQNAELQKKVSDPLNGIRNLVNNFNLE